MLGLLLATAANSDAASNKASLADWLAAGGTVLAVVVALGVVAWEYFRTKGADKRRRKNMVAAWADFQDPQDTGPRLVVLCVGPEVVSDWKVFVCTIDGCSAEGPPHDPHEWSDDPTMSALRYGALPPGVRVHPLVSMPELRQGVGIRVIYLDPDDQWWERIGPKVNEFKPPAA